MTSGDVVHRLHPILAATTRHVSYHSAASLTFLVWNSFLVLDDEVDCIWTMRNTNLFKWVYLFLRYAVMLAHVMHNLFIEQLANGTNPPMLCNMWFIYVLALSQTIATLLEFILASRVFALYNRSMKVAFLLLLLIVAEAAGTTRILSMPPTVEFHGTCLLLKGSKDYNYQSLLGFLVHCTLIGLTWFKYYMALKAGWGRTPLVSLVVRDGSTVYVTIIVLVVSVMVTCGIQNERGIAVVFWTTSLMSVSGCRMILSMERFARRVPIQSPELMLTSEFNIGTRDPGTRTTDLPSNLIAPSSTLSARRTVPTNHQRDSNIGPLPTLRLNGDVS